MSHVYMSNPSSHTQAGQDYVRTVHVVASYMFCLVLRESIAVSASLCTGEQGVVQLGGGQL